MNKNVNFYFEKAKTWREEISKLRDIVLDCGLDEELRWGCPCYRLNDRNIVLIHGFKDYCALLFVKGALLSDHDGLLVQQTENVQAGRQMRFTNVKEITRLQRSIKAYIYEAREVEKSGLKIPPKKTEDYEVPEEFQKKLSKNAKLKKAFEALTPGRQRAYLLYFSGAKQPKTREARIEKYAPRILDGYGLHD